MITISRAHLWCAATTLSLTLGLAAALSAQGLSYDLQTTATMIDPRTNATTTRTFMAGHGQFANGLSRIDVTESLSPPGGMMGADTYMITNGPKGTTTMVDPTKRTYVELNPGELGKSMAGLQQALGGMAKTEVSDIAVGMEDLGAGEAMDGYATLHYRLTERYTMNMSVLGRTTRSTEHTVSDIWVAPQLDGAMNPTARPTATSTSGPMAELMARLTAAYANVKKGVILKRVATSEAVSDGKTHTSTMTMTLSNVKRGPIAASVFQVPSGYTKDTSLSDAIAPLGAIGDSLNAARARAGTSNGGNGVVSTAGEAVDSAKAGARQGTVDAAKAETKDAAEAKVRKGLGRLFGRP